MKISTIGLFSYLISIVLFGSVVLSICFFVFFKTRKSDRKDLELAELEVEQEAESKKIIINKFGKQIFLNLNPRTNKMNINQTDLCNSLLMQDEVRSDSKLRFYLHLKKYWFYFIDGDYLKAIKALESALEISPTDVITNIRLAEGFEYIGNGKKAVDSYTTAKNTLSVSLEIMEYINEQIKRIERDGPKKAPPMPGFRYMTY